MFTGEEDDGLLDRRQHRVLLGTREQAAHYGLDFGARERDGVGLRQRLVCQSLRQSPDRANERAAKVVVGTVRALHEAAGPGRVIWIAHARAEVAFDLVVDSGLGLCQDGGR
jgi:hypothetical protein